MSKYFIAGICLVFLVIIGRVCKKKEIRGWKVFLLKTFLWVLFLEVTVFNINSYRMDFSNSQEMIFDKEKLKSRISIDTDGNQEINLDNLNCKVDSIYIKLNNTKTQIEYGELDKNVNYEIYYSDETTVFRYLTSKVYNDTINKTKYSSVQLSRKCKYYFYKGL